MKGKNGPTPFLPSKYKTGGEVNYIQNKEAMCLTEKQAEHVYKVIEKGDMINTKTMTCETAQIQDDNPYKKVVLNKDYKEEDKSPEMRNWSIFSDNVRYVQHDQATPQNLNIDTLDYRNHKELYLKLREEKRKTLIMTYLGQTEMTRDTKIKAKERFPITSQGFASGKLLDGMACQIFLDTAATKSYMSKSYYLQMQNSTCTTQVLFKHTENSSEKQTIC